MVPIGLVYSIYDSTELAIQKMIEASQRMIDVNRQVEGKGGGGLNPATKRHLELQIKTLQNAPRSRQVRTTLGKKEKAKGTSNAH
jgi:hypothetical protein